MLILKVLQSSRSQRRVRKNVVSVGAGVCVGFQFANRQIIGLRGDFIVLVDYLPIVRDLDGGNSNVFRRKDLVFGNLLVRGRIDGQMSLGLVARSVRALGEVFVMALRLVFLGLKFFQGLLEIFSHFTKLALFVFFIK